MDKIRAAKATFTSLTEHLDTRGPGGEALMQMIGVFAQYAEPAVMQSRELDSGQNTARFLKVSNVMSVWRYA